MDAATTFQQVYVAGERFGRLMGQKVVRAVVMVATAVFTPKGSFEATAPRLPGWSKAMAIPGVPGKAPMGRIVSEARATVAAKGRLQIALPAGVMAMELVGQLTGAGLPPLASEAPSSPPTGERVREAETEPGEWVPVNHSMPPESSLYESQITQRAPGYAYRVKNVKMPDGRVTDVDFDGFIPGKEFQECKGPGYKQFLEPKRPGRFKEWFEKTQRDDGMVSQARRQFRAANGLPVRWYVAEPEAAEAIRNLFKWNDVPGIEVVYRPLGR